MRPFAVAREVVNTLTPTPSERLDFNKAQNTLVYHAASCIGQDLLVSMALKNLLLNFAPMIGER